MLKRVTYRVLTESQMSYVSDLEAVMSTILGMYESMFGRLALEPFIESAQDRDRLITQLKLLASVIAKKDINNKAVQNALESFGIQLNNLLVSSILKMIISTAITDGKFDMTKLSKMEYSPVMLLAQIKLWNEIVVEVNSKSNGLKYRLIPNEIINALENPEKKINAPALLKIIDDFDMVVV